MSDPNKVLSEIYIFLHILIRLDHKLREHLTKSWGNFDAVEPLLMFSSYTVSLTQRREHPWKPSRGAPWSIK